MIKGAEILEDAFIEEQLWMLDNGFEESQIKDNVFRYVFVKGIGNIKINALIFRCMDMYAYIILKHKSDETND